MTVLLSSQECIGVLDYACVDLVDLITSASMV